MMGMNPMMGHQWQPTHRKHLVFRYWWRITVSALVQAVCFALHPA